MDGDDREVALNSDLDGSEVFPQGSIAHQKTNSAKRSSTSLDPALKYASIRSQATVIHISNLPCTLFSELDDVRALVCPFGKVMKMQFLSHLSSGSLVTMADVPTANELVEKLTPIPYAPSNSSTLEAIYEDKAAALDAYYGLNGQTFWIGDSKFQLQCIFVDISDNFGRLKLSPAPRRILQSSHRIPLHDLSNSSHPLISSIFTKDTERVIHAHFSPATPYPFVMSQNGCSNVYSPFL